MRLAFFTHSPLLYGANRSMLALIAQLCNRGHASLVVGPSGPIASACRDMGLDYVDYQLPWWTVDNVSTANRFWRFHALRWLTSRFIGRNALISELRKFAPDWLYSNTGVTPLGWLLSRRLKIPHLWHLREFVDLDFGLNPQIGWPLFRRAIQSSTVSISVSRAVHRHFFPGNPTARHAVVYEGVGPRHRLEAMSHCYHGRFASAVCRFVLVGMLQRNKGQHLAVEALSKVRMAGVNASLTLVGGGEKSELQTLAAERGVTQAVRFTGHLDDPLPELRSAHVALMCSPHEAFGRSTAEAMAMGLPVIGVKAGGTPELVRHGETGLLFDGAADTLATAMLELASDPARAAKLGAQGAKLAQTQFADESYADGVLAHLDRYRGS